MEETLGARAAQLFLSDASCDASDPTLDSQVVRLKEFRMMRFTGDRWEAFGPIVAD